MLFHIESIQLESKACHRNVYQSGLKIYQKQSRSTIFYHRIYIIWTKVDFQLEKWKHLNLLSMRKFVDNFKQEVDGKNGLHQLNAFVQIDRHYHH